ncbi:hypothetical protein [Klebsiella pneumoniae]|uniref:hypothetical protein n=1 Tax=Klebsiella pneumoniae TaxID=573 RepID=UPI00131DF861|nr:hypothetical protein [Klebsiella pneumoniae]
MFTPRHVLLEALEEALPFVPDDNLPLVTEAALLLSDLLPPWDNKVYYHRQVESLLMRSMAFDSVVEDKFYSEQDVLNTNIE